MIRRILEWNTTRGTQREREEVWFLKLKLSLHSANLVQEKQAKSESGESRSDQQIVANKVKSSLERKRSRERERERNQFDWNWDNTSSRAMKLKLTWWLSSFPLVVANLNDIKIYVYKKISPSNLRHATASTWYGIANRKCKSSDFKMILGKFINAIIWLVKKTLLASYQIW